MSPLSLSSNFLNVFQALSESGTLLFPALDGTPLQLTRKTRDDFQGVTAHLLEAADRALEDSEGLPHPLPATNGAWRIEESMGPQYVLLSRKDGRFLHRREDLPLGTVFFQNPAAMGADLQRIHEIHASQKSGGAAAASSAAVFRS